MKFLKLLFLSSLFLTVFQSYSQIKVDQITYKIHDHYITTTIGYPVTGTFMSEGKKEPIVQLNPDGSGIFQFEDLTKENIVWGIECTEEGVPTFKEGFNSATYTFWYRDKNKEDWNYTQFSIHFNKKKMFIMGERMKDYEDYNEMQKQYSK
ncbi:hypothetical protein NYQ10_19910 [Flavobacterium johnsoniae]|uniref:hypothetical protein n=1 Tax=Flavobacterium johnsoniae TaxID=986 RepID=UPI0025B104CF|nr:hypothetical protein [Flavobacterium johnsoniae]WJS94352.1 hypothetical protein NYQ10_19910 [Flavobacterium johnsoniae]